MLKKITILIISCLFAMTILSGCSYWNGHSYNESKQLVADALEKKYGEEFVVVDIGTKSGGSWDAPSSLSATCYSKNHDMLAFEARYYEYNDSNKLYDMYIQEIVSKEIKSIINSHLSSYYDKYAVEVAISGLTDNSSPEITTAKNVTIESFSVAMAQNDKNMYCDCWIVLDNNDRYIYSEPELKNIIYSLSKQLHYMNVFFEFCYVDNDILTESIEIVQDESNNSRDIEKIINIEHKEFGYHFDGKENTITKYEPRVG